MMDLAWWIAVVAVPLVGAVFGIDGIIHAKASASASACHQRIDALSKELSDYKVNAAMLFAQVGMLRELKEDIGKTLSRIENKLDDIEGDLRVGSLKRGQA